MERINEYLLAWVTRNSDYLDSPDFRKLYQLPSISRLWGYGELYFRLEVTDDLLYVTQLAGRHLAPDDMALYLYYTSKSLGYAGAGKMLADVWVCYSTAMTSWHP